MTTKKVLTPLSARLNRDIFFNTSSDLPQIVEIDLAKIRQNPDQPRKTFSEASLTELAQSIERHGLIQPITVKRQEDDTYLLVAGERRFRAFQRLEKTTIPAILTHGDPEEIALIENIQREDLNPLEEAEALSRMMERHRYTQEQLGQIIGKAQNTISQFLALLRLPETIRSEYQRAPIASKSILMEIARLSTEAEQLALWDAVREGRLTTVKAAREQAKNQVTKPKPSPYEMALAQGDRFVKVLEQLTLSPGSPLPLGETEYRELSTLLERLHRIIKNLRHTPPVDHP